MGWKWIHESVVLAIHESQLDEHGGGAGLRDEGALTSALERAKNRVTYGDAQDAATLAAAYAYGIASNHPFADGNKRVAFVVMELFLELNGWMLAADDAKCVAVMQGLAAGGLTEEELSAWIRKGSRPV